MTAQDTERIINEVAHSLSVEGLTMTEEEKENLRRVARGELTYQELLAAYIERGHGLVAQAK
jgi:hypothetical protein